MKFKPEVKHTGRKDEVIFLRIESIIYEKIKNIAQKNNIKISNLCRQMIYFALENHQEQ